MKRQKLEKDQHGRHEIYVAQYNAPAPFGGSWCLFSNLDSAIFFVVSGLGSSVDWSNFPDPNKKYPHEDRNGSNKTLTPVFIIKQINKKTNQEVNGSVTKMGLMSDWIVGNGIAEAGKKWFAQATGRDIIKVSTSKESNIKGIRTVIDGRIKK